MSADDKQPGEERHAAWLSMFSARRNDNEVTQHLGMEARHIVKAIKTPKDGPLSADQREKIRTIAAAHLKEHGITRAEVAIAVDYSLSTLSEILSGSYKGDPDGVLRALNQFVEDDEQRRRAGRPIGFYATNVFQSVLALAKFAKSNARTGDAKRFAGQQDRQCIALGTGPAGIGKSAAAAAIYADDPLAIYTRIEEGGGAARAVSWLILKALGGKPRISTFYNMQQIKEKLTGSGRLLIVDEAHRLVFAGCELIRDLGDVCGIPILMLGTTEVSERLTRVRSGAGNLLYDQFSRRVGMWLDLTRGLDGEGGTSRPIFSIEEIREIFKSSEVRLTRDGEEYLQACACTVGVGMLGLAYGCWQKAFRAVRNKPNAVIDAARLRDAARVSLLAAGLEAPEMLMRIDRNVAEHRRMRVAG